MLVCHRPGGVFLLVSLLLLLVVREHLSHGKLLYQTQKGQLTRGTRTAHEGALEIFVSLVATQLVCVSKVS